MRVFEVFNTEDGEWYKTDVHNLKVGNIIRIFDNGKRYINFFGGADTWVITKAPYLYNYGDIEEVTIDVEPYGLVKD